MEANLLVRVSLGLGTPGQTIWKTGWFNYGEARAAESRADFIHKLKIALKELNETAISLRIVRGSFAVDADFLTRLVAENTEFCKILVASIQTARRNDKADQR